MGAFRAVRGVSRVGRVGGMIDYPNRVVDIHIRNKLRELIDAANGTQAKIDANSAGIAALAPPLTLAQIQNAIQLGGSNPINITGLQGYLANPQASVTIGTHAVRLTAAPTVGTFFWETDRTVLYLGVLSGSAAIWHYAAGTYSADLSVRPADLTSVDIGFIFQDITSITQYEWSGTQWNSTGGLYQVIRNGSTVSLTDILILQHLLNNLAGGIGMAVGQLAQLVDDAKTTVDGSRIQTTATVAAAATFTTSWSVQIRNAVAALADYFVVLITGIKFKVGGFFAILTHANSADRTYTLSNEDGNLVYETSSLTDHAIVLGNAGAKVKPGPLGTTVTVLHGNASGDPAYSAVSLTADVTGLLPLANGGLNSNTAAGGRATINAAAIQVVGGGGAGTYTLFGPTTNGSITITAEGTVSSITAAT